MDGGLSHLALAAAVGAALLTLAALAAVGSRGAVRLVRDLGLGGVLLALFIGVAAESLARSLAETAPYTLVFPSTVDLDAQALMEDADLRTRTNVDARLRYISTGGGDRVPNLESAYRLPIGPWRTLDFPAVQHATPEPLPHGVEPLGEGDPTILRREVAGLYENAKATLERSGARPDEGAADLARTASVGLLVLGLVGLVGGLLPLLVRLLRLLADDLRLVRATRHRSYQGARPRARRAGAAALAAHHFADARPFANLATLGLLTLLGGLVMGILREEETRRAAHAVFTEARHLRIEGKRD